MGNKKEEISDIYIKKMKNLVSIASYGLFENILYLYENKETFDDKKEINNLFESYILLLNLSEKSNDKEVDKLLSECVKKRIEYKENATKELYNSYNIDFVMDTAELVDKSNSLYDDVHIESISTDAEKEYLISLITDELIEIDSYDKFSLSNICALSAVTDKNMFETIIRDTVKVIPFNLIQSFLDNILLKAHHITKTYKPKEFKNPPLTAFDLYSSLFSAQNQMIVMLTFFDEVKTTFSDYIMEKDNFFALKKILVDDDIFLIEKITEINDEKLDESISENEQINDLIDSYQEELKDDEEASIHQYIDFLEEVLFEDLHFFMQSTKNAQMGIKVSDEIISTFNTISEFTHDETQAFDTFFKNYYLLENKLSFSEKLIFNKSVFGIIISQLIFLGYLKSDLLVDTELLVKSINNSFEFLDLNEVKLLTAYIVK